MLSSRLGNTREIRDKFHFCAIHFLWERKSAMVLIYILYIYHKFAFGIPKECLAHLPMSEVALAEMYIC